MTAPPRSEELSRTVQAVPGVAFLTPGLADRLRSALPGTASRAGPRISHRAATGRWEIDVRIVALAGTRASDVTRATRTAVLAHLTADGLMDPEEVTVTVTITGIV